MSKLRPQLGPRSLRCDGQDLPLFSGALHYFRVPRRAWGRALGAVKHLGVELIETYVPWGVHEIAPGRYRFDGQLDLGAFLDAAHGEGLGVLVRPGPHINAELTWFGLPERIVADNDMQARTGRGTPVTLLVPPRGFPVPSYASRRFLDAVRDWYAAVGEVVAPRCWPHGPVVAVQVDNEHGNFFRQGPFDGDYHPDALGRWHAEHQGRPPPRKLTGQASTEELAHVLDWITFRERQTTAALRTLSALLAEAGLDAPRHYHNFPPLEPHAYDIAAAEDALDFAGVDLYHRAKHYARVRERALFLAGSSRLPYVPEVACGSFAWGPPFSLADTRSLVLGALMHGVAGLNYYMLVERDRWYGSPISEEGELRRDRSDFFLRLHRALGDAGWTRLSRRADIAVVVPRDYRRLAMAASQLGPIGPAFGELLGLSEHDSLRETNLGLSAPVQLEQLSWRNALLSALSCVHLPFVIVESSVSAERLAVFKLLLVPTFDFLDPALIQRLRDYHAAGGHLVCGPRMPTLDNQLRPLAAAGELGGDRLTGMHLDDPSALEQALLTWADAAGATREPQANDPCVDTTLHSTADGTPTLLFVATRSPTPLCPTIELATAATVEDVFSGQRFSGATLDVPLHPHEVRLLRFV